MPLPVNGKLCTAGVGFVPDDVTDFGTVVPCPRTVVCVVGFVVDDATTVVEPRTCVLDVLDEVVVPVVDDGVVVAETVVDGPGIVVAVGEVVVGAGVVVVTHHSQIVVGGYVVGGDVVVVVGGWVVEVVVVVSHDAELRTTDPPSTAANPFAQVT